MVEVLLATSLTNLLIWTRLSGLLDQPFVPILSLHLSRTWVKRPEKEEKSWAHGILPLFAFASPSWPGMSVLSTIWIVCVCVCVYLPLSMSPSLSLYLFLLFFVDSWRLCRNRAISPFQTHCPQCLVPVTLPLGFPIAIVRVSHLWLCQKRTFSTGNLSKCPSWRFWVRIFHPQVTENDSQDLFVAMRGQSKLSGDLAVSISNLMLGRWAGAFVPRYCICCALVYPRLTLQSPLLIQFLPESCTEMSDWRGRDVKVGLAPDCSKSSVSFREACEVYVQTMRPTM